MLPNFPISHRDGSPDEVGLAHLQKILTLRAEAQLFTPGALAGLVGWSGGLARELIILTRRACLAAMEAKKSAIDEEAVVRALELIRQAEATFRQLVSPMAEQAQRDRERLEQASQKH